MTEIFRIKFGKYKNEQGIPCHYQYTLGVTGMVDGEMLTPVKIEIRNKRVITAFKELGIKHEFAFTDDVEIYRREKPNKEENEN